MRTHDEDRLELRSLQQQVHDRLLGRILRRELEPGERISPPEIAAALGVSITPVRDAVNQMAAEGLVTVTPRRGTVVSPVSIRDIEELYEIRLMVEPQAAEMAASRATETRSPGCRSSRNDSSRGPRRAPAASTTSRPTCRRSRRTRSCTPPSSEPPTTSASNALYEGLRTHVLVARAVFPRLYRGEPHRRGEHRRIVEAIAAHDGAAARDAMAAHLRQALADTLRHVEQAGRRADRRADDVVVIT